MTNNKKGMCCKIWGVIMWIAAFLMLFFDFSQLNGLLYTHSDCSYEVIATIMDLIISFFYVYGFVFLWKEIKSEITYVVAEAFFLVGAAYQYGAPTRFVSISIFHVSLSWSFNGTLETVLFYIVSAFFVFQKRKLSISKS